MCIEQANRKESDEFDEQVKELTRMLEIELKLPSTAAGNTLQVSDGVE